MATGTVEEASARLMAAVREDGVAIGQLNDGYIVAFDKDVMQELMDKHPDAEEIVIFVRLRESLN
jgi:hypothetical protein